MISCGKCLALRMNFIHFRSFYLRATKRSCDFGRPLCSAPSRTNMSRVAKFASSSGCQRSAFPTQGLGDVHGEEAITEEHLDEEIHEEHDVEEVEEMAFSHIKADDVVKSKKDSKKKEKSKSGQKAVRPDTSMLTEAEMKLKERISRENLASYIKVCMQHQMTSKAVWLLTSYHYSSKLNKSNDVYNALLLEAGSSGHWKLIGEVMALMEEGGVHYNHATFAACFVCLGQLSKRGEDHKIEVLTKDTIEKMKAANLKLEDMFLFHRFQHNHRELAVLAIRHALPCFEPPVSLDATEYCTQLLMPLNDRRLEAPVRPLADGTGLTTDMLLKSAEEQYSVEVGEILCIPSISSKLPEKAALEELEALEKCWESELREAVCRQIAICRSQFESKKSSKQINIYPYLSLLPEADYVRIVMDEIRLLSRLSELYSPAMHILNRDLGVKVMERAILQRKKSTGFLEKMRTIYDEYCNWYVEGVAPNEEPGAQLTYYNPRQMWQHLQMRHGTVRLDTEDALWPSSVVVAVGDFLYNIILSTIKIQLPETLVKRKPSECMSPENKVPALYTVYRAKSFRINREVKPHPYLAELWQALRHRKLCFDPTVLPMLSPPVPWHAIQEGGYLTRKVQLVRLFRTNIRHSTQFERMSSIPLEQMFPAFDALNVLGSVPWRINGRILDLVIDIFNAGGDSSLDIALDPTTIDRPTPPSRPTKSLSPGEKIKFYRERLSYKRQEAELYSLWCDALYRLSLAQHYRNRIFWFPHSMDFRGRAYPCPPHLTYLAHDMGRALFRFAQGKRLGPDGLNWLKLHAINLTGLKKKESVAERLRYANQILPDIIDSARNPMTGKKWWTQSEEPWQTLATCMEIDGALCCPDGPENFVSHLPIHQDGSCNGLQHYAALGRDEYGAMSVNLAPGDRPGDVYSDVAQLVEKTRTKDAALGNPIAQILEGHVSRKTVKQTVMTVVYGVTRFGARLQIAKQLKEVPNFPEDKVPQCSTYLADQTFHSLKEMFSSAREIQDWLTESARLIVSVVGGKVEWVTPLGFPVVQPYVKTNHMTSKPNGMKQRNGYAPNFIHSLDSSHMMLTSLYCQRQGLTFASVHDCFWTHPCTVAEMNKICRQQFVSLHSQPILENLSKFLIQRFVRNAHPEVTVGRDKEAPMTYQLEHTLLNVPRRGNFDLNRVKESVYFFS